MQLRRWVWSKGGLVVGALWLAGACALPHYRYEDDGSGGSGGTSLGGASGGRAGGGLSGGAPGSGGADSGGSGALGGDTGSGGQAAVCTPEDVECAADGVTPRTCTPAGQWQEEDACPFVCTNGTCQTSCPEGDFQCAEGALLECDGGIWDEGTDCPFVCDDEVDPPACAGECEPGTKHCASVTEIETCSASGFYDPAETCDDSACKGEPAACSGECFPGSEGCVGNSVAVCLDSGEFEPDGMIDCDEFEQTCTEDTSNDTAACTECESGDKTCVGWDVHSCVDGVFELETTCDSPGEICRDDGTPSCDANTAYNVGESGTAGWQPFSAVQDVVYWAPITLTKRALLVNFRVRLPSAPTGANAIMALYGHDAVNNRPAGLVTDSPVISLGTGINDGVANNVTNLDPGTYWIAVLFDVDGVPFSNQDGDGYSADSAYPILPATYPPAMGEASFKTYPLFLAVQDAPN